MALTDLLNRYDSWLIKTEVGDKYTLGDFNFYPSVILIYQSDKFVDYYYGVTQEEASRSLYTYYKPSGGFQIGAQTYISYPITEDWSAFLNIRADKISNDAANSPLVDSDYIYSGLVSLIYTFEY
jgi:outer membrane protein